MSTNELSTNELCTNKQSTSKLFYQEQGNEVTLFKHAFEHQLPVLIKGPTGCGKTRFIKDTDWERGVFWSCASAAWKATDDADGTIIVYNNMHYGLDGGNPTMNTPRLRRGGGAIDSSSLFITCSGTLISYTVFVCGFPSSTPICDRRILLCI